MRLTLSFPLKQIDIKQQGNDTKFCSFNSNIFLPNTNTQNALFELY